LHGFEFIVIALQLAAPSGAVIGEHGDRSLALRAHRFSSALARGLDHRGIFLGQAA
jgi:hypothetical protein